MVTNNNTTFSETPKVIAKIWEAVDMINSEKKSTQEVMSETLKINIRPVPFQSTITIELGVTQNEHVIVRMTDKKGNIVRLFGWHLIAGTNVTSISGLASLESGEYIIEVISHLGINIISKSITKK